MEQRNLLVAAMAERCLRIIESKPDDARFALPDSLRPGHLTWMCRMVVEHAEDWPPARAQRWLGFIQAGMIANYMLTLGSAKTMFDQVKEEYGPITSDPDLLDHLSPRESFEIDIGGQG
jgi:hypothetical protein